MDQQRKIEREEMVTSQIIARGIQNKNILTAMRTVPRHLFVPEAYQKDAYRDYPLPISEGQTISQPYMVALMTELLNPKKGEKILEIGTGSGYQTAILLSCGAEVISIERIDKIAIQAKKNLNQAGFQKVTLITGDGSCGYPKMSPYDGILITAGTPVIPEVLIQELSENGRLVAPVGNQEIQEVMRITRKNNQLFTETFGSVRFVPLIGKFGWREKTEN